VTTSFSQRGSITGAPEPFKAGPLRSGDVVKPAAPYRWMVNDVSLQTGKIRWQQEVRERIPADGTHMKNSYSSETPTTDGERVYAYFSNVGVFEFDMNGKPVWSKPMGPFTFRNGWGSASSPVLYEDRLYIVNDNETDASLLRTTNGRAAKSGSASVPRKPTGRRRLSGRMIARPNSLSRRHRKPSRTISMGTCCGN
jgi:hypothetical protein